MGALERSPFQRMLFSSLLAALLLSSLTFTGLMVWHARHLSGPVQVARSEQVTLGPLRLAELSKAPAGAEGYHVGIQMDAGLGWLLGLALVAAGAVAVIRFAAQRRDL